MTPDLGKATMKIFKAIILAAATLAAASSGSLADEKTLAPGKPAGVQQAARGGHLLMTLGVAAVLIGVVVVAMNSSNSATPPTSTAP
jgi:hypothetical protein